MAGLEQDIERLKAQVRAEERKLELVQEIGQALSSARDLDALLVLIMDKVTILMEADRSTLYLLSDDGAELWSKVLQSDGSDDRLEIRLKVGEGVAGWVAQSGETVNLADAYADQRFYPLVDLKSGYRTTSMLCMPMRNNRGATVGVIQMLNKVGGAFTAEDEVLASALASQAAVALENVRLYQSVLTKNVELTRAQKQLEQRTYELNILYDIERDINQAPDLDELLDRLLRRAMGVIGTAAGSILLRERDGDGLYFRSSAGDKGEVVRRLRVTMTEGVAGWVAAHQQPVLANRPADDPRYAGRIGELLGYHPRNLLCVPLVADEESLGVIELLDKNNAADFDDGDLRTLVLIAGQASKAIQLARAKDERMNQGRLAAIGQMLSGVLHDLKTPMTVVSGYAQLMAQIDDPDERARYVEHILRQFDTMSAMTREVLAFARGQYSILVRKVYLHKFFEEVASHLEHELAGKHIKLVLDLAYKGVAYFDEQKLLRVIHNLARNAAQAMPGGGTIRLACRLEADRLIIEVGDTGMGIPAEMEGRLFDLFATAGKKDGSGLGLAIVKKIIDEHQGTIAVTSQRDAGTTFTISLPAEKRASSESGPVAISRN